MALTSPPRPAVPRFRPPALDHTLTWPKHVPPHADVQLRWGSPVEWRDSALIYIWREVRDYGRKTETFFFKQPLLWFLTTEREFFDFTRHWREVVERVRPRPVVPAQANPLGFVPCEDCGLDTFEQRDPAKRELCFYCEELDLLRQKSTSENRGGLLRRRRQCRTTSRGPG